MTILGTGRLPGDRLVTIMETSRRISLRSGANHYAGTPESVGCALFNDRPESRTFLWFFHESSRLTCHASLLGKCSFSKSINIIACNETAVHVYLQTSRDRNQKRYVTDDISLSGISETEKRASIFLFRVPF
jgi:hypothetical protein